MTNENPGATPPPPLPTGQPSAAETKPVVGYCRACGLALHADTVRQAMGTLYCLEHVPATAGPSAPADASQNPYASPYAVPPGAAAVNTDVSPGLAFLLGLIPGVGAIYNGQYAKGLVHAIVMGLLIAAAEAADGAGPLFGLLASVFFFYMAFEAYHTAKRRQAGLPVDEFSSIVPGDKRSQAAPILPVILIGFGVIFLLINFDLVSFRYLIRWWPVGLIALGGYMLYDRMAGSGNRGGFSDVQ